MKDHEVNLGGNGFLNPDWIKSEAGRRESDGLYIPGISLRIRIDSMTREVCQHVTECSQEIEDIIKENTKLLLTPDNLNRIIEKEVKEVLESEVRKATHAAVSRAIRASELEHLITKVVIEDLNKTTERVIRTEENEE